MRLLHAYMLTQPVSFFFFVSVRSSVVINCLNMERKACLRFLVLFLGVSYLLSSTAVSATRNLKSINNEIASSVEETLAQDAILEVSNTGELFGMWDNEIQGRMDLESKDYAGTGANSHHDPKTPGRSL